MKKIFGNTNGLKAAQIRTLENLYHFKTPPELIASPQMIDQICGLSHETNRQVGILIHRTGRVTAVIIGDHKGIMIPDTSEYKTPPGRLKGLRCVHTHMKNEPLSHDDLTDLTLLRLDLMAAVTLTPDGKPDQLHMAHILPNPSEKHYYQVHPPAAPDGMDIQCADLIKSIESELLKISALYDVETGVERAILISVTTAPKFKAEASLRELDQLARSCGIHVIETLIQHRKELDSRFLMGKGKLGDLTLLAMQKGTSLIIFDQELNPSQIRSITDKIDLKVIDRTQLILDIFAQRAQSREGKLQVELAQLKYLLPRLITKNTAMSRLTGGIGGRGPGETKLEINRRRAHERIAKIEKELENVKKQRRVQKSKRDKKGLPVISIIGYTNAGKSTLLNTLTKSDVLAEDRLFATLDPSSRRIRFPKETEVIITDTVGFIRDLPRELKVAFRATLEELESADLLIHVIDASNPDHPSQVESVNKILEELELHRIQCIKAVNKIDQVDPESLGLILASTGGIPISANDARTLFPLIDQMERLIEPSAGLAVHPDNQY
ncbi:MAG: GTPase HflX [Desulfobacterales bacterium]|jgi:GTP-binding protein HflX|nr:GTPase HflX [Desulfobacterales bacterium]